MCSCICLLYLCYLGVDKYEHSSGENCNIRPQGYTWDKANFGAAAFVNHVSLSVYIINFKGMFLLLRYHQQKVKQFDIHG